MLTPRYDVERFGIRLQGSPRHADILICTGPVTRQARDRLRRIYEQLPEPKFVVAVGSCAISGGVFKGCYNVEAATPTRRFRWTSMSPVARRARKRSSMASSNC